MSTSLLVAVPSDAPGGLDSCPSAHFGHCAAYTVARIENGEIVQVSVEQNEGHEHGNCLAPVQTLAKLGVTALIAGGMGARPLQAMHHAGITVYFSQGLSTVGEVIEAFSKGNLVPFDTDNLCKGHCNH